VGGKEMNEGTSITVVGIAMIAAIGIIVLWVLKTLADQKARDERLN
jgi:hypothetical protein